MIFKEIAMFIDRKTITIVEGDILWTANREISLKYFIFGLEL